MISKQMSVIKLMGTNVLIIKLEHSRIERGDEFDCTKKVDFCVRALINLCNKKLQLDYNTKNKTMQIGGNKWMKKN